MVRAAAKNHASVAIVTSPDRYAAVLRGDRRRRGASRPGSAPRSPSRPSATRPPTTPGSPPSCPAGWSRRASSSRTSPACPNAADPYPPSVTIALEKVETLRYGENPHQVAARYRRPGASADDGPFATGAAPLQGKQLSYNNVLDASAAAAIARTLEDAGCVIVKHTNPCGAAERDTLVDAWAAALAGDPVSAFGGVVAVNREVDRETAEGLVGIFLELVVAPGFSAAAREILATKPNLRLIVDPTLAATSKPPPRDPDPLGSIRTAGGAVLVTAPDTAPDDPDAWQVCTTRHPTDAEWRDLQLAWRLVRAVTSNAIVLVRDGRLIGLGSGQTSRVDAARQAVDKALAISGEAVLRGASCASDAFYPFPDGVDVCLGAGVTAFVQPGGSMRDAEVIAAAENAGATMLADRGPPLPPLSGEADTCVPRRMEGSPWAIPTTNEEVVRRYLETSAAKDFDALASLRHPDWQSLWPQSGERVVGHAHWAEIAQNYPGGVPEVDIESPGGLGGSLGRHARQHGGSGRRHRRFLVGRVADALSRRKDLPLRGPPGAARRPHLAGDGVLGRAVRPTGLAAPARRASEPVDRLT